MTTLIPRMQEPFAGFSGHVPFWRSTLGQAWPTFLWGFGFRFDVFEGRGRVTRFF